MACSFNDYFEMSNQIFSRAAHPMVFSRLSEQNIFQPAHPRMILRLSEQNIFQPAHPGMTLRLSEQNIFQPAHPRMILRLGEQNFSWPAHSMPVPMMNEHPLTQSSKQRQPNKNKAGQKSLLVHHFNKDRLHYLFRLRPVPPPAVSGCLRRIWISVRLHGPARPHLPFVPFPSLWL
ncbi:hypothetical protein SAMN05878391_1633 [Salinicoccus kekensis]|uniref:Uncharacterized protein n=1 Tax=Salinicoccus kekensis TaxID=714307 RepID=A0A285UNX1_9STAP|nr:hypothetical protein SAMN05878391_1633 [Salinicoccus kekensis]